jgi:outer membrane receptor protein involved in Fe transport
MFLYFSLRGLVRGLLPCWVVAAMLGLSTGSVLAQAESSSLHEVVVSGSRTETKLSETPVSIGAVSQETWNADKTKSVGEIINRIPGVFWNDLGNEQHSMGIRQPISTNAVYQYLEDGIPIRPLGVFNHNALNETNMNGSGGVEVVKGAASSLYGSNAVGGAVNFLTLEPSRTPTGYLGLRGDAIQGYSRLDSGASNTWGDLGLRFSHYSSYREHDNWQTYSGGKKDSLTLRGDYNLGLSSWLKATLVHTNLVSDMTGSVFENTYRSNPGQSINTFTWRKDKTTRANLSWEGETTAQGLTTVTVFARNNDHGQLPSYTISTCSGGTCPTGVKGTINNNHVESTGVDIKHVQELAPLKSRLVTGVYIDRSQNDYVSDNLSVTKVGERYISYVQNNSVNPSGVRDYGVGIANDAVFAQWEYAPNESWRLVAGGRHDSITYDFKNKLTPNANFGAPNEVRSFAKFSPKLGATYAVNSANSVYGNLSRGFTPPEVSQLYGKSAIPELTAASYENRELGWRSILANGIRLDSALYQLNGENTIVSYTISPGNSENRNAGKTRSEGLELALSQQLVDWDWLISTSLAKHTYLAYKLGASEDYSGKTMPQAPNQTVNAQVAWKVTPVSRLSLGMVHQSHYWMNNLNTVSYDGHTLWNVNATHQIFSSLELWAQIRNIEDKRYADSASSSYKSGAFTPNTQNTYSPGAPRSYMVGLTWSMK